MLFFLLMIENMEDRGLMQELYDKYSDKMLFAALEILEKKEDAEAAVHNAFVTLIVKYHGKYEKLRDKNEGFFVVVARNKARDIKRRKMTQREIFFSQMLNEDGEELEYDPPDKLANTEESVVSGDTIDILIHHIKALPEIHSEVLERSLVMEMSNREIARAMKISESVVSSRLSRAKEKLRKRLAGEEADKLGL